MALAEYHHHSPGGRSRRADSLSAGGGCARQTWELVANLDALHRALTIQDLRLPAGNRLEALKGDRSGFYSVRVNGQYRITFRFQGGYADAVTCEDYH